MNEDKNTYTTSDLALSAFLKSQNLKIINLERVGGSRKLAFVFDCGNHDKEDLVRNFHEDIPVGVKTYFDAVHEMKKLIFSYSNL